MNNGMPRISCSVYNGSAGQQPLTSLSTAEVDYRLSRTLAIASNEGFGQGAHVWSTAYMSARLRAEIGGEVRVIATGGLRRLARIARGSDDTLPCAA
jgi:hypothetical protein